VKTAAFAALAALALGAPVFAGDSGTLTRTRTYTENGTRAVSTVGTVDSASYSLDSAANGLGASAVSTGSYTNGGNVITSGTATTASTGTAVSASSTVSAQQMIGAAFSDTYNATTVDLVTETLTGVFAN